MHHLVSALRPPRVGQGLETARPLCGPAVGYPNDGVNGDTGVVSGRTPGHPAFKAAGNPQC